MSDSNKSQFLFFQADDGAVHVNVLLENETVWLTQAAMAELFACTSDNISLHLKNIYETGELNPEATTEDFSVVRQEGTRQVTRLVKHHNLDAIIAITAKNYLSAEEMKTLGLLVEQYLAFAEAQTQQRIAMTMDDWIQKLDAMLTLNGRELLTHAGRISHRLAEEISAKQLDQFRQRLKQEERIASLEELEKDIDKAAKQKDAS